MARKRNSPVTLSVSPLRRSARIRRKVIASSPVKCTLDELRKAADLPKLTRLYQISRPVIPTDKVEKLCEEYVKFLYLKAVKLDEDGLILSPSAEVDGVWHQHILDTKSYRKVCETVGFNIDHDPEKMYDDRAKLVRRENTYVAYEEVFGEVMDGNFWSEMHELKALSPRKRGIVSDIEAEEDTMSEDNENEEVEITEKKKENDKVGVVNLSETRHNDHGSSRNEESPNENNYITIRFHNNESGEDTLFTIVQTTELSKLFKTYARRHAQLTGRLYRLRFLFNGDRINGNETPLSLKLNEMDKIEVIRSNDEADTILEPARSREIQHGLRGTRECQIEGDKALTIMLQDQTGEATNYKVRKRTRLSMVFQNYAERKGVARDSLRFMLDGDRVNDDQTPLDLEIYDGDVINVMLEQSGC